MDAMLWFRAGSGLALALAVFVGWRGADARPAGSRARVEALRGREVTAKEAQTQALARELNFTKLEGFFVAELEADFQKLEVAPISNVALKEPHRFADLVREPLVLAPGRRWSSDAIELQVLVERVTVQRAGAAIGTAHRLVRITNAGERPLAYLLRAKAQPEGECIARGARQHNAMALLPGESADIVVCANGGQVRVEELKILEVTPLGYAYLSKLSPLAVGHDATTAASHRAPKSWPLCMETPVTRLTQALRRGDLEWEDVADFYARHSCERFQIPEGYRRAAAPLAALPVTAEVLAAQARGQAAAPSEPPAAP
jgi:hypothetical protein